LQIQGGTNCERQRGFILEEKLHVRARIPDLDRGSAPWDREHVEAIDKEPQAETEPRTPLRRVVVLHKQLQQPITTK
jgi:hypothetical protein